MARLTSIFKVLLLAFPLSMIVYTQAWAQYDDSDEYYDQGANYDNYGESYPSQPYNSDYYRSPSPAPNSSSDNRFANPEDPIHFKIVDGDFWFRGKCRSCDRMGAEADKMIAQKSKPHPKSHPKNSSQKVKNS